MNNRLQHFDYLISDEIAEMKRMARDIMEIYQQTGERITGDALNDWLEALGWKRSFIERVIERRRERANA